MRLPTTMGHPAMANRVRQPVRFGHLPTLGTISTKHGSDKLTVYKTSEGLELSGYWNEDNRSKMNFKPNRDKTEYTVTGFWNHSNLGEMTIKKSREGRWEASGYWPEHSNNFTLEKKWGNRSEVDGFWGGKNCAFNQIEITDEGDKLKLSGLWDGGQTVASDAIRTKDGWEIKENSNRASVKPNMTMPRMDADPETDKLLMLFFLLLEGHPQQEEAEATSKGRKVW